MIQTNASGIMKRKEHARKGHERMKRRLISLVLVLMLVMTAGCGKKSTTKKLKTEDLDEATLQGMAKDITKEMSLKNKIGQLFMVSVYQLDEAESKKANIFRGIAMRGFTFGSKYPCCRYSYSKLDD